MATVRVSGQTISELVFASPGMSVHGPDPARVDEFKSIGSLDDTDRRRRIWRMDDGESETCATPVHGVDGALPC